MNSKNTTQADNNKSDNNKAENNHYQPTVVSVFGELVWLMQTSPFHKHLFLSELEWAVLQPMILQQYRIYHKDKKPVGAIFWASVDDDVHKRLQEGSVKMRPHEWKSGSHNWIIDVVAPFGNAEYFINEIGKNVFKGHGYHYIQVDKDGRKKTISVNADN